MCDCVKGVNVVLLYQLFSFDYSRMTVLMWKGLVVNAPAPGSNPVLSLEIVFFFVN